MQEMIKEKDNKSEELFLKASEKLFTDIKKPNNSDELAKRIKQLSKGSFDAPILNTEVSILKEISADREKLIQTCDTMANFIAYNIASQ